MGGFHRHQRPELFPAYHFAAHRMAPEKPVPFRLGAAIHQGRALEGGAMGLRREIRKCGIFSREYVSIDSGPMTNEECDEHADLFEEYLRRCARTTAEWIEETKAYCEQTEGLNAPRTVTSAVKEDLRKVIMSLDEVLNFLRSSNNSAAADAAIKHMLVALSAYGRACVNRNEAYIRAGDKKFIQTRKMQKAKHDLEAEERTPLWERQDAARDRLLREGKCNTADALAKKVADEVGGCKADALKKRWKKAGWKFPKAGACKK